MAGSCGLDRTLSSFSTRACRQIAVEGDLERALRGLVKVLESSEPARIDRCICSTWLIFSDGALETVDDKRCATIGAVLESPKGCILESTLDWKFPLL